MRCRIWILTAAMVGLTAVAASAAFTAPSERHIKQAAKNPAFAALLVEDANPDEAAMVIKDVLVAIFALNLDREIRDARIVSLVRYVFNALPDHQPALAAALGRTLAASPSASGDPRVVSLVQQTAILVSGNQGGACGAAFGNAYSLAMQSIAGAPGGGKMVPPTPPPPPVILPYSGQRMR